MTEIRVYDPALCCDTGVCGPRVDTGLVRFAADLEWLRGRGVAVRRFNLGSEPAEFVKEPRVRAALQAEGPACLPLVLAGGEIVSRGRLPARAELAAWGGAEAGAA